MGLKDKIVLKLVRLHFALLCAHDGFEAAYRSTTMPDMEGSPATWIVMSARLPTILPKKDRLEFADYANRLLYKYRIMALELELGKFEGEPKR